METEGPPPAHEPDPRQPIELSHRSWWRSNVLQVRFAKDPWSGCIGLLHMMPEGLRAALNTAPDAQRFLARHDRLGGFSALLMAIGCVATCVFGVLGWHHWTTAPRDEMTPEALAFFSLALLGTAGFGASILVGIDSFRMFLKAVDAYNAHVRDGG